MVNERLWNSLMKEKVVFQEISVWVTLYNDFGI